MKRCIIKGKVTECNLVQYVGAQHLADVTDLVTPELIERYEAARTAWMMVQIELESMLQKVKGEA